MPDTTDCEFAFAGQSWRWRRRGEDAWHSGYATHAEAVAAAQAAESEPAPAPTPDPAPASPTKRLSRASVYPSLRPGRPARSQRVEIMASDSAPATNPLHELCNWLDFIARAWEYCVSASTTEEKDQRDKDFLRRMDLLWNKFTAFPSEAQRGLADPALGWLSNNNKSSDERIVIVENAAQMATYLATHPPVSGPDLYSEVAKAAHIFREQSKVWEMTLDALDALRKLSAVVGVPWKSPAIATQGEADRDQGRAKQDGKQPKGKLDRGRPRPHNRGQAPGEG